MRRSLRSCRESSSNRLKLLLDSTYLLPILGVEVEGAGKVLGIPKKLREQGKAEYYYTPFSLLEILGKLSKISYDKERVARGLVSIEESFRIACPTADGYLKALELKAKGFKDLIDLLLYTTALTRKLLLISRDSQLIVFLEEHDEDTSCIVYEEEFLKRYSGNEL